MIPRRGIPLLILVPPVLASGCITLAKAFLDIPESTADAGTGTDQIPEGLLEQLVLKPPPLPPPAIEGVSEIDSVLALLPSDRSGGIDWVAAVESDVIRPKAGGTDAPEDTTGAFSYDLYLSDGDGPEAYFPHSAHRAWMDCTSCHPRVYRNGSQSSAPETAHGEASCGYCHGSVAFPIQSCERCHERARDLPRDRREKAFGAVLHLTRVESGRFGDMAASYPPSSFPHDQHRLRFQCRACHERPFPMVSGGVTLSQDEAHSTTGCGRCHDGRTAFAIDTQACYRCHIEDSG